MGRRNSTTGQLRSELNSLPVDPLLDEVITDQASEALRKNKFQFNPLTTGQRRTVSQRLQELDVDPIAVLAALAVGLDPRTGEPLVAVKPIKMCVTKTVTNKETGKPDVIREEVVVNHEYPGATGELMAFCAKELASYCHPKLKQIEVTAGDDTRAMTIMWSAPAPKWTKNKQPLEITAHVSNMADTTNE